MADSKNRYMSPLVLAVSDSENTKWPGKFVMVLTIFYLFPFIKVSTADFLLFPCLTGVALSNSVKFSTFPPLVPSPQLQPEEWTKKIKETEILLTPVGFLAPFPHRKVQ